MTTDRELRLRITADAAQAKAELESLQQAEQGVGASAASATSSTNLATVAFREQGEAAGDASEQIGESSDVLSDAGSAATVAGLGYQKLQGATAAATGATVTYTTATERAAVAAKADAIAETQRTIATTTAATATNIEAVAETGQATATRFSTAAAMAKGLAEINVATATKVATAATDTDSIAQRAQGLAYRVAGAAVAGKELAVSRLATGLLKLAGPVLGVVTVVALLPAVIKLVVDKVGEWSTKIGESIVGLNEQAGVIRKAGESTDDYQKRVNEAADKQALWDRALHASRQGLIDWSDDVDVATARYIVHMDSIGKGNFTLKQVEDAYKQLGLTVAKVLSFEEALAGTRTFMQGYQKALSEGENATRRYVEANKEKVKEYMESFEDLGTQIPKDLQAVADKYDVVTEKQKEATQVAKDHAEAMKLLTPAAKAAVEASESLLAAGIASGKAFQFATLGVEAMLKSIQKIDFLAPMFVTQSGTIVTGLQAITAAAALADRATNSLFAFPNRPGGLLEGKDAAAELFAPEDEISPPSTLRPGAE